MRTTIAILDKRGEDAVPRVVSALMKSLPESYTRYGLATPTKVAITKDVKELLYQKGASKTAVGTTSTAPEHGEKRMLKTQDAAVVFDGRIYSPAPNSSTTEVEKIQGDYEKAIEGFFRNVEGDFSIVVAKEDRLFAARDPLGVQPLYYGENGATAALASNRKALWKLGVLEPKSFPPGCLAIVTKEGFKLKPVQTLKFTQPKQIGMNEASKKLQNLLECSLWGRVSGLKEVAVAFSGGLDSGIIAYLAKKCRVDTHLVHVSLEGQPETQEACEAAEQLELPIQVHLYTEADLEKILPMVVDLIEEPDPIKVSVGVPFFWAAQKAAEAGCRILFAGQGADELFGGYQRYVAEYVSKGEESVRKTMFHDVSEIHESNLERDEKICGYHDVQLRLPFASFAVAEFAMSLPIELKIEKKTDSLRKLVLRKTAENLGLPRTIVEKPKKAMQYGTGINRALKKLAKKKHLTVTDYLNCLFQKTKSEYPHP